MNEEELTRLEVRLKGLIMEVIELDLERRHLEGFFRGNSRAVAVEMTARVVTRLMDQLSVLQGFYRQEVYAASRLSAIAQDEILEVLELLPNDDYAGRVRVYANSLATILMYKLEHNTFIEAAAIPDPNQRKRRVTQF